MISICYPKNWDTKEWLPLNVVKMCPPPFIHFTFA